MQLSINAIVILVLAMAILGLGLGIVRGITQKKDDLLDFEVKLEQTADATDRIANIKDQWELRQGKEKQVGVSFFNSQSSTCVDPGAKINISCESPDPNNAQVGTFAITQIAQPVDTGASETIKAIITANGFTPGYNYGCKFQITCEDGSGNDQMVESETIFIDMLG